MQGGINDFLGLPQVWCHVLNLARLVIGDEFLRLFETGASCKQGATTTVSHGTEYQHI